MSGRAGGAERRERLLVLDADLAAASLEIAYVSGLTTTWSRWCAVAGSSRGPHRTRLPIAR